MFTGGVGATAVVGSISSISTTCVAAEESSPSDDAKKPVLMKVGSQRGGTGKRNLEYLGRHGVYNMDGGSPKTIKGVGWNLDDSLAKREACEHYGISLDAYHLPLSSAGIRRVSMPHIMLGKSPERDREIEMIQQMISVAGKTGIKTLNYNTTIHPVLRTDRTIDPNRGNASYSTWNYEKALAENRPNIVESEMSIDQVFENIAYFLERVLPVAEEYQVRLANHIADPPTPAGFGGITRWNSPDVFKGIQRFAKLSNSPAHGFNLCLGSVAEGLKDPKTEILPIIKWVGDRKQIFNVHLRNIIGGFGNFQEVYPDNGDMDLFQVIKALRDV
ncbi:MAG: mannonate dehydratase, partial [Verrucomicrobia bacterium]|nr:mannonate dehydratase [Verrucomicrobiota bacterium]